MSMDLEKIKEGLNAYFAEEKKALEEKKARYGEEETKRIKDLARAVDLRFHEAEMLLHPEVFTQEHIDHAMPHIKMRFEIYKKELESYEKFNRKKA